MFILIEKLGDHYFGVCVGVWDDILLATHAGMSIVLYLLNARLVHIL